jgi:hypothetical protein
MSTKTAQKPAPKTTPPSVIKPSVPAQDDIAIQGTVMKVVSPTQVRLRFTDPNGKLRTPVITKKNHGFVKGDYVVVLVESKSPYSFVSLSKQNDSTGPTLLPVPDVENKSPMLPMADIPDAFEKQSQLTFAIAPDIDEGPRIIPGYVKTSCLLEAIDKCGKKSDDNKKSNFNLGTSTKMPLPLPMAPRETFSDMFLQRDFLNGINNMNIDYKSGMDYSVDYEVDTTPFVQTKIIPPAELGSVIPDNQDVKVPRNLVLAKSDAIIPADTPGIVRSRADTPIVDMIANGTKSVGQSMSNYMKTIGAWLTQYYAGMQKNNAIQNMFQDNSKIIGVLIAIAVGSFIVNAGVSAIVVGIILLIALKSASGLF